jgi:hypothetical protein
MHYKDSVPHLQQMLEVVPGCSAEHICVLKFATVACVIMLCCGLFPRSGTDATMNPDVNADSSHNNRFISAQ